MFSGPLPNTVSSCRWATHENGIKRNVDGFSKRKCLLHSHIMKTNLSHSCFQTLYNNITLYLFDIWMLSWKDYGHPHFLEHFMPLFLWMSIVFSLVFICTYLNYIWFKNIARIRKFGFYFHLWYQMMWHFDLYTDTCFQLWKVFLHYDLVYSIYFDVYLSSICNY